MNLEAFKLLFANRPEAPEGVEFWEWAERPHRTLAGREAVGRSFVVPLWQPSGPPWYVYLWIPDGRREVFYFTEREGALSR